MAEPKTRRPTGLSIARSNSSFVCKWKITDDDYGDGQTFQWWDRTKNKWRTVTIGNTVTQKAITLDTSKYYPTTKKTLTAFSFRVRGNRAYYIVEDRKTGKKTVYQPTVSDWTKKTLELKTPERPILSATPSTNETNVTTFSWAVASSTTDRVWIRDVQYQTILVKESNVGDGSKLPWKSTTLGWDTGTSTAVNSRAITEDTSLLAAASYTRWFRVRARGIAGPSEWRYAKHVYAKPYQAKVKSASVQPNTSGGYTCKVVWNAPSSVAHPIDSTTVQYAFAIPLAGMQCPDSAGWQNADTTKDTGGDDAAAFSINNAVDDDQCMFVRVNTKHDSNITNGDPVMVTAGYLADPDNLVVSMDQDTRRASITADNNSQNPDSYLAVVYSTSSDPNGFIIGVIEHGETTVTVQAPAAVTGQTEAFSVYAVVGEATATTRADGVSSYAIDEIIRSHGTEVSGGDIPQAPSNVTLAMTDTPGTIRVTFEWAWQSATAAELSWADHADAWESTSGPSVYILNNTHASAWNISGLATGKKWFVRVRLTSGTGEGKTYGAYSEIQSIELTSAPAVPVLTLSSGVLTTDDSITASWGYVSGDGSTQAYAEIAEAVDTSTGLKYGTYTESIDDAVTIDEDGEERLNGKTYYTRSGSGTYNSPYVYTAVSTDSYYTLTSDASIDSDKTYYTRTGSGTSESPYVFTKVASPDVADIATYYEIDADPSTSDWYEYSQSIAHVESAQHVVISAEEVGWLSGEVHNLVVRVVSESGRQSEWSDPVSVTVADPIAAVITQTSLESETVTEDSVSRTIYSLTEMPLTITVTGAGAGGTTSVVIERAAAYHIARPDETEFHGYEGETIVIATYTGEGQIEIGNDVLVGSLDDEAQYRIIATVQDGLGQSAEATLDFEVHWDHQAVMPEAEVEILNRQMVAVITPQATDPGEGDVCDIYRLSVDRPELIYPNAEFGTAYVDPYPAIGEFGGHRIVYKTANGDYITEDNQLAWIDLKENEGDILESNYSIIDFGSGRILVNRNLDISNSWSKDFQETRYLGGSIQGDWNPAVSRKASVTTVAVSIIDQETIQMMRRLAVYAGICHIRTSDGSSYAANIEVSDDYSHRTGRMVITYSLTINRVDPEEYDGLTYDDWQAANYSEAEQPIVGLAVVDLAILAS